MFIYVLFKATIFSVGFEKHVWRFFCLLCILFFEEFCKLYERGSVNLKKFGQLNVVTVRNLEQTIHFRRWKIILRETKGNSLALLALREKEFF